jgi:tetratricopeptide (TPR) repeat protein
MNLYRKPLLTEQKGQIKRLLCCLYVSLLSTVIYAGELTAEDEFFNRAKTALKDSRLDEAVILVEKLLESSRDNAEHYYLAGRIASEKALNANIFSRLGYAHAAKKYFTKAKKIDPQHQDAIIGLIRFHQQAPVMAGADRHSIPELFKQLRVVDARSAFLIQAPALLENSPFELVEQFYIEALAANSKHSLGQFQYDAAMWFSAYGHYQKALEIMLSIDASDNELKQESKAMRLYQLAKLTAETNSQLEVGIKNIQLYAALPAEAKTIAQDWVEFRLAQLQFLKSGAGVEKSKLLEIQSRTSLAELKAKIDSFLKT